MKHKLWLSSMLLVTNFLWAADATEDIDEAFLAFLGQWETDDGEWLPPEELEKLSIEIEDDGQIISDDDRDEEILTYEHETTDEHR